MTKKELEEIINSKKYSKAVRCFGDDKLRDFIQEIYSDGMREGYALAICTLETHNCMRYNSAKDYVDEHMEDIREILKLCEQYESCSEEEDSASYANEKSTEESECMKVIGRGEC